MKYLPGSPVEAMASMMSDLLKHSELADHAGLYIAPMLYGAHKDPVVVRSWIEAFQ